MNKKGFTLVELIATIAILGIITIVGVVGMGAINKASEKKTFESALNVLITNANTYGEDNKNELSKNGETITLEELNDVPEIFEGQKSNIELKIYPKNNRMISCIKNTAEVRNALIEGLKYNNYPDLEDIINNYLCS